MNLADKLMMAASLATLIGALAWIAIALVRGGSDGDDE